MQANARLRRRSNLGKRRKSAWPEFKPEQPQFSQNRDPVRTALGRHFLSAKKTPGQGLNKANHEKELMANSNELLTKKRLFELKSPMEMTSAIGTPIQDVTGVASLNPSPDYKPSSSYQSPHPKTWTTSLFNRLERPKSPVLTFRHASDHLAVKNFKPPIDPEDSASCNVSSNSNELALKDCTSHLTSLEISDNNPKNIALAATKSVVKDDYKNGSSVSNHQRNSKLEVTDFSTTIGQPSISDLKSVSPILKEMFDHRHDTKVDILQNRGPSHNHQNEQRNDIKQVVSESKEGSQEIESLAYSTFNEFKKPESILQVLRSSEKKLSVVNEDESESPDDSFTLAEETISELTIVGDRIPVDTGLKSKDSANFKDFNGSSASDDDDINELINHIDRISKKGKEQQVLFEKKLTHLLEESKKWQIIREKELAQLRQCASRLKKRSNGKHEISCIENKENESTESNMNSKNQWSQMKKNNPNLLKTPNVRRTNQFSLADQSTVWTPHSLSKMVSNQVDDLYD